MLLGAQKRDLSHNEEPAYLISNQALQLQRQLIQLQSSQDQQLPQLRQHLWLVQGDQQPVLFQLKTGLDQQAW